MLDQFNSCDKENIVRQLLKVQAQVKVTPIVAHGAPKVYCMESDIRPLSDCCNNECDFTDESDNNCNFTLTQIICVEIPISFDADVDIKKGVLCCDIPDIKPECNDDHKDNFKDDTQKNNPIFILMNNKIQF